MKFYVLERRFDVEDPEKQFSLYSINSKDKDTAWEEWELHEGNNCSQAWILNLLEFAAIKILFNKEF